MTIARMTKEEESQFENAMFRMRIGWSVYRLEYDWIHYRINKDTNRFERKNTDEPRSKWVALYNIFGNDDILANDWQRGLKPSEQ